MARLTDFHRQHGAKGKLLLQHLDELLLRLDELLLRLKGLAQHSLLSSQECLYHRPGWWWWYAATTTRHTKTNREAACRFQHLKELSSD
jgi:hypothetical protein